MRRGQIRERPAASTPSRGRQAECERCRSNGGRTTTAPQAGPLAREGDGDGDGEWGWNEIRRIPTEQGRIHGERALPSVDSNRRRTCAVVEGGSRDLLGVALVVELPYFF